MNGQSCSDFQKLLETVLISFRENTIIQEKKVNVKLCQLFLQLLIDIKKLSWKFSQGLRRPWFSTCSLNKQRHIKYRYPTLKRLLRSWFTISLKNCEVFQMRYCSFLWLKGTQKWKGQRWRSEKKSDYLIPPLHFTMLAWDA